MPTKFYGVPCVHETQNINSQIRVSDYHPLRLREIIDLIDQVQREDKSGQASIQGRLIQGIQGVECPRREYGKAHLAQREINELYTAFLHGSGQSVDDLAVELYQHMKAK